jgi:hypothetical protein
MSFQISQTTVDESINNIEVSSISNYSNLSSNIIPATPNINLGSSSKIFTELYTAPGSISLGNIPISSTTSSLTLGNIDSVVSLPDGNLNLGTTTITTDSSGKLALPMTTQIGQVNPGQIVILGSYPDVSSLNSISSPNIGDSYIIQSFTPGHLFTCTYNLQNNVWADIGPIEGPQGPIGAVGPVGAAGGIFSLVAVLQVPGIVLNAGNPNVSNSIVSNSVPGSANWSGRVQSINGYNNSPCMLSFTISISNTSIGLGNQLPACVIGFSSSPTNTNTTDYSGYFHAAFLLSIEGGACTAQIISNYGSTPINIIGGPPIPYNSSVIFSIIFDGNYFNYYINNIIVGTTPQSPTSLPDIGPAPILIGPATYYFTSSFPGGLLPNGTQININNIVFAPYSSLNPRVSSSSLQNSWVTYYNGTVPNPYYLDINNTFVLPIQPNVGASSGIQSSISLGSLNNPLQGFIFSFVAFFSTSQALCLLSDQANTGASNFRLTLTNYIITVQVNNNIVTNFPYLVGDIIQIFYNPTSSPPTTTIYQNQNSIFTTTQYVSSSVIAGNPATGTKAYIINVSSTNSVRVINPMFYSYGPINTEPSSSFLVAGGSAGNGLTNTLSYSIDGGITWTAALTGAATIFPNIVYDVFFNNNIWVATGSGIIGNANNQFQLAYSYDGLNWVGVEGLPTFTVNGRGICLGWNGSYWLAGGEVGSLGVIGSIVLVTSKDGVNWTNTTGNISSLINACTALCWNGSLWVGAGQTVGTQVTQIIYSNDGITWFNSVSGTNIALVRILKIIWNGNIFLAVGGSFGSPTIAWSRDGVSWTNSPNNVFALGTVNSVAWNGAVFIACGNNFNGSGYKIASSPDGITWTEILTGSDPSIPDTVNVQQFHGIIWNRYVQRWVIGGIPFNGSGTAAIVGYSNDINGGSSTWNSSGNSVMGNYECFATRVIH